MGLKVREGAGFYHTLMNGESKFPEMQNALIERSLKQLSRDEKKVVKPILEMAIPLLFGSKYGELLGNFKIMWSSMPLTKLCYYEPGNGTLYVNRELIIPHLFKKTPSLLSPIQNPIRNSRLFGKIIHGAIHNIEQRLVELGKPVFSYPLNFTDEEKKVLLNIPTFKYPILNALKKGEMLPTLVEYSFLEPETVVAFVSRGKQLDLSIFDEIERFMGWHSVFDRELDREKLDRARELLEMTTALYKIHYSII